MCVKERKEEKGEEREKEEKNQKRRNVLAPVVRERNIPFGTLDPVGINRGRVLEWALISLDFSLVFRAISEISPISLMGYRRYPQLRGGRP